MIDYGPAPSNQSELQLGSKGDKLVQRARLWVHENPEAFERYKRLARHQAKHSSDHKASPNSVREQMRGGLDVLNGTLVFSQKLCTSVNNAISPALARVAMEQDPELRFRVARSSSDGFVDARFD